MDFMINSCFRVVLSDSRKRLVREGVYRVLMDEVRQNLTCAALIVPEGESDQIKKTGRPPKLVSELKRPPKKPLAALVGKLFWFDRDQLLGMHEAGQLVPFSAQRRTIVKDKNSPSVGDTLHAARIEQMQPFLDIMHLQESIVVHHGIGGLVRETMARSSISKSLVYKLWSQLLRYGLDENSLYPNFDRCGAPGVFRPCDPPLGGAIPRKKAGRKSLRERVARMHGKTVECSQPGMTLKWTSLVLAADKKIPLPKPRWKERHKQIISSGFAGRAAEVGGKFAIIPPALGDYPSSSQVKWLLTKELQRIQRVVERTTKRHFASQMRGLKSRMWAGVAGPNHTWAIDSTIGDVFLRSSINRAWIIGRPVLYIVVDVWSTAIVGFYVCLTGPSWSTASVALFNATCGPAISQRIYDYTPMGSLFPCPSLCYQLLCDRGEYLSKRHAHSSLQLGYNVSFTPPYRGDLKGLVEVTNRIAKDEQFLFIPGAIDYRRKELELRKSHPEESVMTPREYVAFLFEIFTNYNFNADRRHRLDADMIGAGVFPSPAGLWRWGHDVGLAYRREVHPDQLIEQLLPRTTARIRRDGVRFASCEYSHPALDELNWTATARNLGGWDIDAYHHPASMGSIWTQIPGHSGLSELRITAEARATVEHSLDEWNDAIAISAMNKREEDHHRLDFSLRTTERIRELVESSKRSTREAVEKSTGSRPTFTEARTMEVAAGCGPESSEKAVGEQLRDEAMQAHEERLAEFLRTLNRDGE